MTRKSIVLTICTAILIPAGASAQRADNITVFTDYWKHRASLFQSLPNPAGEICFLGDSITEGCEWSELTGVETVTNRGISGDTAWGVLARLDEVTEGRPSTIFLMIGTNDLARGKTPEEVRDKITEVVEEIGRRSPETTVFLQSVLPTDESKVPAYRNENISILNNMLAGVAESRGTVWVDLAPAFRDGNGRLRADLSEDGLHINGTAYGIWLSLISEYLSPVPGTPGSAVAITHGPYLQLPTPTSVTIVWHTSTECVSRVEYGTDESLGMTAVSSRHGLIDNDRTSHIIRLTGLDPGREYSYRVVSREFLGYERQHIVSWGDSIVSGIHHFTTLDPEKERFSFCMVSDVHEEADELRAMIMTDTWEGIDFALYNGDMIDDFMRPDQIFTGFLDVSVDLFAKEKAIVFARGNHEVRGRFARSIPDFIPTSDDRAYYSFDHGGVHFIVLDSGEDKEDGHEYYNGLVDFVRYREEQADWLRKEVVGDAFLSARYRVVISHIPPREARAFGAQSVREHFEPIINEAGVDLWLSGHTHRYSRLEPTEGENAYQLLISPRHATTRVDVSPEGIRILIIGVDGTVVDTIDIRPRTRSF